MSFYSTRQKKKKEIQKGGNRLFMPKENKSHEENQVCVMYIHREGKFNSLAAICIDLIITLLSFRFFLFFFFIFFYGILRL